MTAPRIITDAVALSSTVAEVVVGRGVIAQAGALLRRHFGPGPAVLIADENTWAAAGAAVEAALRAAGIATTRHILPAVPRPKPTVALGDVLRDLLAASDATPVAVGSGVINDVVKYAAFGLDRPYLCVATAASMDGYTSAGAPLSDRGFKKTIQCRPAKVVLGDLDVIAAAPLAMTGWGYGDLAGKVPAGADWIVADALGIEPVDTVAWPMVQDGLAGWLAEPSRIAAGDPAAIAGLFTGLTLVGLAMELHGSSRPASGADHQIAHLWEMEDLMQDGERVSHGACVAVGCVAALGLYEWLLARGPGGLDAGAIVARAPDMAAKAAEIRAAFGPGEIADRAIEETRAKHLDPAAHRARLECIAAAWPSMAVRLRGKLLPAATMAAQLRAAGAPARAADIGVTPPHLRATIAHARFLRSRYTVLDLFDQTGLLAQAIAETVPDTGGDA
ncbi:sn-glycerol-1-phosphate dehydrogenase [Paracoccaceae bacterium Fryx2]|nr:sn-glycerol-1-phosphate dehydrogenase [Paracoccaceae bacterium Fryx2]